jgi:hypothetical protein
MNALKAAVLAVALAGASVVAADADAGGRHRHHHHRSHVGIWFGAPLFYPSYHYYPRYYYPPVVVSPPPVYIEQPQAAAPAPSSPAQGSAAYWYYCRDSQTYYPYVQQCASPWQQVVPNSAPPS